MPKSKTHLKSMGKWKPTQKRHILIAKYHNGTPNTRSIVYYIIRVIETACNTMSHNESPQKYATTSNKHRFIFLVLNIQQNLMHKR